LKQITLRGLSEPLAGLIRKKSEREGLSLNRSIVLMLEEAAGLGVARHGRKRHHDLDHLAGAWKREEAEEFDADLAAQRRVEEDLWKAAE
jgi:hypothetical protein